MTGRDLNLGVAVVAEEFVTFGSRITIAPLLGFDYSEIAALLEQDRFPFVRGRPLVMGAFRVSRETICRLLRSVPELCQNFTVLAVLRDLARQRDDNLLSFRDGRGSDSVPGHHFKTKHLSSNPAARK